WAAAVRIGGAAGGCVCEPLIARRRTHLGTRIFCQSFGSFGRGEREEPRGGCAPGGLVALQSCLGAAEPGRILESFATGGEASQCPRFAQAPEVQPGLG